jgi:type I restriction enzyme S subunit
MGQAPSGEAYNTEGRGWPLIAGAGDFGETKPAAKKFTTEASKLSQNGDIVLGIRASIGEKVLADGVYCLGRGVAALRARSSLESRFLWHWLAHSAPCLAAKAKGATFKQVNREDIAELEIELPPLAEQRRIAEVLDKAEALRAKRRAALAQLDSLTQSLFLDLFGDPMKNERGWTLPKVGVAGRVQLGRQRAPKYQSGKHTRPYVRVANVYEDRLDLSDVLSMDFDRKDFKSYRLEHGDILLNEGQSTELVGRAAMWRNEIADCCFQNTLVRFQPNRETTLPEFALALFLHYFRTGEFAKISSKTSNVAHLGAARFAAMPFPLPPLDLQREFARRVAAVEKLKTAQRAALAELDALFASLQHRAFRGEL